MIRLQYARQGADRVNDGPQCAPCAFGQAFLLPLSREDDSLRAEQRFEVVRLRVVLA